MSEIQEPIMITSECGCEEEYIVEEVVEVSGKTYAILQPNAALLVRVEDGKIKQIEDEEEFQHVCEVLTANE